MNLRILKSTKFYFGTFVFLVTVLGTQGAMGKYGFMDDYAALEASSSGEFDLNLYLSQGRPVSGFFAKFVFSFIDSINDLLYLHILGSVTLGLFALGCFYYFSQFSTNNITIALVSIVPILVSPGFLLISAWAVMSIAIISIAPAVIAAILVASQSQKVSNFQIAILLLVSFLSYPPMAIIFIALPCLTYFLVLVDGLNEAAINIVKHNIKKSFVLFAVSGAISLVLLKMISSQFESTSNRTDLIGPLNEKLSFMFKSAIPTAFDFLSPGWGFSNYGFVAAALVVIIPLLFLEKVLRKSTSIVLIFILFTSFSPNFLTAENWASNRSLSTAQWVVASLALISLLTIVKKIEIKAGDRTIMKTLSPVLLLMVAFSSNNLLISTMRNPQLAELSSSRIAISKLNPDLPIEVVKSEWTDGLAPWVVGDEFGIPSSCQPWVPVPLTKLILREQGDGDFSSINLVVEASGENFLDYSKVLSDAKNN